MLQFAGLKLRGFKFILQSIGFVFVFALIYKLINGYEINNEMKHYKTGEDITPMSLTDCFYYALVTQTTVGYGDFSPQTKIGQYANIIQLMSIYGIFGLTTV